MYVWCNRKPITLEFKFQLEKTLNSRETVDSGLNLSSKMGIKNITLENAERLDNVSQHSPQKDI